MRVLGAFMRDIVVRNPDNFRIFGPDETASNRLGNVFDVTSRARGKPRCKRPTARVSHARAGCWRSSPSISARAGSEGYLLTGRHSVFNCYEAFIHIVDSMFSSSTRSG